MNFSQALIHFYLMKYVTTACGGRKKTSTVIYVPKFEMKIIFVGSLFIVSILNASRN